MCKNVIHIYGASGSGTSTLGKFIAKQLGYNQEYLMVHDYKEPKIGFGEKGRWHNAYEIIDENQINYMNCKRANPCDKGRISMVL